MNAGDQLDCAIAFRIVHGRGSRATSGLRKRGGDVGVLLITCPVTGKEFSTGIETDAQSLDLIPDTVAQAHCPHCGSRHSWSMLEARLSEGGSPAD
jgi:hypothetical protein